MFALLRNHTPEKQSNTSRYLYVFLFPLFGDAAGTIRLKVSSPSDGKPGKHTGHFRVSATFQYSLTGHHFHPWRHRESRFSTRVKSVRTRLSTELVETDGRLEAQEHVTRSKFYPSTFHLRPVLRNEPGCRREQEAGYITYSYRFVFSLQVATLLVPQGAVYAAKDQQEVEVVSSCVRSHLLHNSYVKYIWLINK